MAESVGILVLCKDRSHFFIPAIERALEKTKEAAIYILDNGSEEAESKNALKKLSKHKRVTLFNSPSNLFCAPGRHHLAAILPEMPDIVVSLDDDITLDNERPLEEILINAFRDKAVGAVTGILKDTGYKRETQVLQWCLWDGSFWLRPKNSLPGDRFTSFCLGGLSAFRGHLLKTLMANHPHFLAGKADYDWSLRLRAFGYKAVLCPEFRGTHLITFKKRRWVRVEEGNEEKTWRVGENLLFSALVFKTLWGRYTIFDHSDFANRDFKPILDSLGISWNEFKDLGIPDVDNRLIGEDDLWRR